ncbi:serine hydrolase domain-containing protein [Rhodococcus sp. NPDC058521]|uniref:serine hydrolase domain-containing protein n=1 Tax=Rhodococcus sp. NPDC058521 TaxID=3346536 RepID=UPI0036663E6E
MLGRIAVVAAVCVSAVVMGTTASGALAPPTSGDPTVIALAQPVLERGIRHGVSVAVVNDQHTAFANFGAENDTEYEIGSLTKTFTAELFVDAVSRGEVREDLRLDELLPLDGTPVGEVTLVDLAAHRSGLPPFAVTMDMATNAMGWMSATNPFPFDRDQLIQQARETPLWTPGRYQYSTFGYALLGQALAVAADTDYATLLSERMLVPLRMTDTWLPIAATDLPADASRGFDALGRQQAPWPLDGYAPAGGIRSTIEDMAGYARQLLDGTVPGEGALTPRWSLPNGAQGALSWQVENVGGAQYTLHSGSTGGFQSIMVLDRDNHRAVVILSNTIGSLQSAAYAIMAGLG